MTAVPTLHVRNVPPELYEELRARAAREGRSMGAEVVAILTSTFDRDREGRELIERLRAFRREVQLPSDAPMPEELIREAREERARRL
jgi:plasmid stability protein